MQVQVPHTRRSAQAAAPVSFSGDVGSLLGSSAAVAAFTADAGCAAADLVGGAGCSIVVPAALASATAVGFESATQDAAAVTASVSHASVSHASVSHASVTWSVRPPIQLTSPQTVFTGVSLSALVSTAVTINNFPASAPVSVWVDGLGVNDLLVSATDDFVALTTAICATVTSNHFNGSGNACSGVLPSRFAPPNDLNLAFNPQANDRAATLHIGEASITFLFNPALRLEAPGGTDYVDSATAGLEVTATIAVRHAPTTAVTFRIDFDSDNVGLADLDAAAHLADVSGCSITRLINQGCNGVVPSQLTDADGAPFLMSRDSAAGSSTQRFTVTIGDQKLTYSVREPVVMSSSLGTLAVGAAVNTSWAVTTDLVVDRAPDEAVTLFVDIPPGVQIGTADAWWYLRMGTGVPGTNPPCDDLFNKDTRCAFVIPAQLRAGFTSPDTEAGELLDFTFSSAGIYSVTVQIGETSLTYQLSTPGAADVINLRSSNSLAQLPVPTGSTAVTLTTNLTVIGADTNTNALPIFFSRPSTDVTFGGDAFTQIISGCAVGTDPHTTNSCSAALPESVRTRLSTAFEIRVADPTAGEQVLVTVNIGTGSIVCDVSLVDPSQLFVLDASPTDLTWTNLATTAE